jgi:prepilin-type N-terminal cleavage/methylation domain-containing protein
MKDKLTRGFTLVEMVISVGLLAILAVIIIVNINKNLKDQQASEYAEFIDKIKSAANVYMAANPNAEIFAKDTDGYNIISIDLLEEAGLINTETLVDPSTNLPLNDNSTDLSKKYIKIYDDEKSNEGKSDATLIQYPATGEISEYLREVKYEMNNFGIGKCETEDYVVGQEITICNPNDDNADFKGWFLDNDLTKEGPSAGTDYIPMEDIILYAKWFKNKSANITSMEIVSATSNYKDNEVNVSLEISDVYGGTLNVCISNQSDVSSCTSWEEIKPLDAQNNKYSYAKNIYLSTYNRDYTQGSGKSVTIYAFVKNTAYEEAYKGNRDTTSLLATKSATYQIYEFCTDETVTSYGTYGSCSKKCGTGTQTRTNKVKDSHYTSQACPDVTQTQNCNTQGCCTKTTSSVSEGSCSVTCGGGTKPITTTYYSSYDGSYCSQSTSYQSCNTNSCCSYTYCTPTGGYYLGQPTYYACGNCGCDGSPHFASELANIGISCSGSSSGGVTSCNSGYQVCSGSCCCEWYYHYEVQGCKGTWLSNFDSLGRRLCQGSSYCP